MSKAELREMTADQKTAYHETAEAKLKTMGYVAPQNATGPKTLVRLGRTDLVNAMIQVVRDGGENNLHYHTNVDIFYMVLRGGVRFHGVNGKVIGEFGECQGVIIPGGARYWFEKTGSQDLELLQVIAKDTAAGGSERINIEAHKPWMEQMGSTTSLTTYDTAAKG